MSAIWGIIDFNRKDIDKDIFSLMNEPYKKYKIDRLDILYDKNIYFACAHQHITKESVSEVLPFKKEGIWFTADAIVDNRKELIEILHLKEDISDGDILFYAYLNWGEQFVNHVTGIFSIAIYDLKKDIFLLYTDHTASRCINYYYKDNRIIFSTIYKPIVNVADKYCLKNKSERIGYNKKWLASCESNFSADIILFEGLTPFEDVFQVKCGSYIKIHNGKLCQIKYWNPLKYVKKIKFNTLDEYKKYYLGTFNDVIASMLRSKGNTALMLSSGLDSTAVGAVAACLLAEDNKNLYTFTAVPHPDFVSDYDDYYITDESVGPSEMKKKYTNIIPDLIDFKDKDALSNMRENVEFLEVPFKSAVNFPWLMEIYEKSSDNDCKILLKGQYGNTTISYGAIMTYVWQKMLTFHFIEAFRQLKMFKKQMRVSLKNIIQVFTAQLKEKIIIDMSAAEDNFLKDGQMSKYGIKKKIKDAYKNNGGSIMDSYSQWQRYIYAPEVFQHLSIFDTKAGLKNGIVIRDPTKDRRIIEMCLAFPIDCFVIDGTERAMVRKFMEDYIPEKLLNIKNQRGLQGADFYFRMNRNYDKNINDICDFLDNDTLLRYLNKEKVADLRNKLCGNDGVLEADYIHMLTLASLSAFFDEYGERNI